MSATYSDDDFDRTVVDRVDPLLGTMFDQRYQIIEKIATGGFGAIYRAIHLPSNRLVALKVLHEQLSSDPNVVERFRREGATLAHLRDPHTVTAYEVGQSAEGMMYIAMELLGGESLFDRFCARGALPWRVVLSIIRDCCSSLAEAHAYGIIHRDLKPENIHLDRGDFVKVLDFGIAKVLHAATSLTVAGQVVGTFDYMSPEQFVGGECDGRSDIFALGVVMFEMISGYQPFNSEGGVAGRMSALWTTRPPPLGSLVAVPAEVDFVVQRCLERDPACRFGNVAELASAIDQALAPPQQLQPYATQQMWVTPQPRRQLARGSDQVVNQPIAPAPAPPPPRPMPQFDVSDVARGDARTKWIVWLLVLAILATTLALVLGYTYPT